jgi:hypothetical protein
MRKHAREIILGVSKQKTVEEGKQYLTRRDADGNTELVARGDTGILGKQFAVVSEEPLGTEPSPVLGEVRISAMDSSLTYMQVTESTEERIQQEIHAQGPEYMIEEEYENVRMDPKRGLVDAAGERVVPEAGAGE